MNTEFKFKSNDEKIELIKDVFNLNNFTKKKYYFYNDDSIDLYFYNSSIEFDFYLLNNNIISDKIFIYVNLIDLNLLTDDIKDIIFSYIIFKKNYAYPYNILLNDLQIDPNKYFLLALKYNNYDFINNHILFNKLNLNEIIEGLMIISKKYVFYTSYISLKTKKIINVMNKLIINKYMLLIDNDIIAKLTYNSVMYNNIYMVKKIVKYYVKTNFKNINNLIIYAKEKKTFNILINELKNYNIKINIINEDILKFFINNKKLLCNMIRKKCIDNEALYKLFYIIVICYKKNCYLHKKILYLIINQINLIFDNKISDILYKKNQYFLLCKYLINTANQHNYNYSDIKIKYENIIFNRLFLSLIFTLKLTTEDANDIINKLKIKESRYHWQIIGIEYFCKKIFKILT